jgi:hypothetical protein
MQTFAISCFRPGTMIAHMASLGSQDNKATFVHEVHFFSLNTPLQQQQLRHTLRANVHVGKFDVPQINVNAPLGTSIFQFQKEREFAEQNQRYLNQKYTENLAKQQRKLLPHEKS